MPQEFESRSETEEEAEDRRLRGEAREKRRAFFDSHIQKNPEIFNSVLESGADSPKDAKARLLSTQLSPTVNEKQIIAGQDRFRTDAEQIKVAIAKRDIKAIGALLGPPIYQARQDLLNRFKENQMRWANNKVPYEVYRFILSIMIKFVSKLGFPKYLTPDQESSLKKYLQENLENAKRKIGKKIIKWHDSDPDIDQLINNQLVIYLDKAILDFASTFFLYPTTLTLIRETMYIFYKTYGLLFRERNQTYENEQDRLNTLSQSLLDMLKADPSKSLIEKWESFQEGIGINYALLSGALSKTAVGIFVDSPIKDLVIRAFPNLIHPFICWTRH